MGNSRDKKLYDKTKVTMTGWFNTHWKHMSQRNRAKFSKDIVFDRWEFEKWIIDNHLKLFCKLFDNWAKNNYDTNLCPSIDRLDNSKGYTFDNMQLITWKENNEKEQKSGRHKDVNQMLKVTRKKVLCIDPNGKTHHYISISEASRDTNISTGCICDCCKGIKRSVKGYRWRYE